MKNKKNTKNKIKKFYKYCSFDEDNFKGINVDQVNNNFDIYNLRDKVVYAGSPKGFNDPFDTIIGLSNKILLNDFVKSFLNKDYLDNKEENKFITNELNKTKNIYKHKLIKVFSDRQPSLIRDIAIVAIEEFGVGISSNHETKKFGQKIKNDYVLNARRLKKVISNTRFVTAFTENFIDTKFKNDDIAPALKTLFSDKTILDKLVRKQKPPFKNSDSIIDMVNIDFDQLVLLDAAYGGKGIDEFKDGIEGAYEVIDNKLTELNDVINNKFGISCFSKKKDDILMWSHYSKKHTGFVVEYDISKLKGYNPDTDIVFRDVKYERKRPIIKINKIKDINEQGMQNEDSINVIKDFLEDLIFVKSNHWAYEKEIRGIVVIKEGTNTDRRIPFDCVQSITLGVNASDELKTTMKELCIKNKWKLYQSDIHSDEYSLTFSEILI